MSLKFDLTDTTTALSIDGGVAAFDPVSLRLAAQDLVNRGATVHLAPNIAGELSRTLTRLSTVETSPAEGIPTSAVATVDTRHLRWDLGPFTPTATDFTDYNGAQKYGVDLGRLPVLDMGDTLVTNVTMRTADDEPLTVWFAELPAELASADALELTDFALSTRTFWDEHRSDARVSLVTIPAQQLTYQSSPDVTDVDEWDFTGIVQKFAAAFDETGARVIAQTMMFAGAMFTPPPTRIFGARGPVVLWFTQDGAEVPFSIIYTSSSAWPAAGASIDIDGLQLP